MRNNHKLRPCTGLHHQFALPLLNEPFGVRGTHGGLVVGAVHEDLQVDFLHVHHIGCKIIAEDECDVDTVVPHEVVQLFVGREAMRDREIRVLVETLRELLRQRIVRVVQHSDPCAAYVGRHHGAEQQYHESRQEQDGPEDPLLTPKAQELALQ